MDSLKVLKISNNFVLIMKLFHDGLMDHALLDGNPLIPLQI